jgi:hypothetical protein
MTKATDTHSEYVIIAAFPRQQRLHEGVSLLPYMHRPVFFRASQEEEISCEMLGSHSDAGGERSILGCNINIH